MIFMYWNLPTLRRLEDEEAAKRKRRSVENSLDASNYHQRAINAVLGAGPGSVNNSVEVGQSSAQNGVDTTVPRHVAWVIGGTPRDANLPVTPSSEQIVNAERFMSSSPGYLQCAEVGVYQVSRSNSINQASGTDIATVPNDSAALLTSDSVDARVPSVWNSSETRSSGLTSGSTVTDVSQELTDTARDDPPANIVIDKKFIYNG